MSIPAIGALVSFPSVADGRVRWGYVVDRQPDHVRVMDKLVPLESPEWSWSEWVPLGDLIVES
jgi:hypothetical protein